MTALTQDEPVLPWRPGPEVSAAAARWEDLWATPAPQAQLVSWTKLKRRSRLLADDVELFDASALFGPLVGSDDLRAAPVHRWFTYKEGFSPKLLGAVIDALGIRRETGLRVADAFGGVATTALAGLVHRDVCEVRSVEYSPFARFVGQTKLSWPTLDRSRLQDLLPVALDYDRSRLVVVPPLSTLQNAAVFSKSRVRNLLALRDHLQELEGATSEERDFLLLGLGAVMEDLSGAMKDGRALRLKNGRSRRASSLAATEPAIAARGSIRRAVAGQWTAMLADLEACASSRVQAQAVAVCHVHGDARDLAQARLPSGDEALPAGWADLSLFSPPYLNCIDYTELYKLELWLLSHVANHVEFRKTRLGTLRSHPSVRFDERNYFDGMYAPVIDLVLDYERWLQVHGARSEVGRVVRHYFEDMLQVMREQYRVVAPGGVAVCIVANSTFSRRSRTAAGGRNEEWRLPVLTDVVLAHLMRLAGFRDVVLWNARELRPRNVRGGFARESLVVGRKPPLALAG